jgi:hypothetical protein
MQVTGNIQNMSADGFCMSSIKRDEQAAASCRSASLAAISARPSLAGSSGFASAARHATTSSARARYAARRSAASSITVGTGAGAVYDGCADSAAAENATKATARPSDGTGRGCAA